MQVISAPDAVEPEVAEILAGVAGCDFVLPFVTRLTPESAEKVAERRDNVTLPGIRSLAAEGAEQIARSLAAKQGGLSLPNLARITPRALKALTAKEDVQLPDLSTIEIVVDPNARFNDDVVLPGRR